jgi:hypothetical protein
VVNSEEVAKDLFELRSAIYSDKPQSLVYEQWVILSHFKHKVDGEDAVSFAADFTLGLLPYGNR